MATQFITTTIFDKLVGNALLNGSLAFQIGGLASDANWALAYPNKLQGNNLNIVPETSSSVRVKAGTIWTGVAARSLAADFVASPLTNNTLNNLFAVDSGGSIAVQNVTGFSPTPPPSTIKLIGAVMVRGGKVINITTIPAMVNQTFSVTPTVSLIGWDKATLSSPFSPTDATNAIQVKASFNLTGVNKVGEFALTTGVALPTTGIAAPSSIIAYLAQDVQTTVTDALLSLTWNLVVNSPTVFY